MAHDLDQARVADRILETQNVVICCEIHRLRDDAVVGKRMSIDRLPPQIFAAELLQKIVRTKGCLHPSIITDQARGFTGPEPGSRPQR